MSESLYEFEVESADGSKVSLKKFEGQVVLVVNVASKCGFTPQYKGLQALQDEYKTKGFTVVGFPCNQFGAQEPGSDSDIQQFCQLNFGVNFPVMKKVDVNGANAAPVYKWLKATEPGLLGTEGIKWNFTKFLIDRRGHVLGRYAPTTTPEGMMADIEKALI